MNRHQLIKQVLPGYLSLAVSATVYAAPPPTQSLPIQHPVTINVAVEGDDGFTHYMTCLSGSATLSAIPQYAESVLLEIADAYDCSVQKTLPLAVAGMLNADADQVDGFLLYTNTNGSTTTPYGINYLTRDKDQNGGEIINVAITTLQKIAP